MWQGWNMFAPNPKNTNFELDAEITFEAGSKTTWAFPKMQQFGLVQRYQKERYRKWMERVRQGKFNRAWPDTARYIARLHANPTNPPRQVSLRCYWSEIPPPTPEGATQPIPQRVSPTHRYTFFLYNIVPGDLL